MAFQVSPGVNVSEIDLTNVVVAAATSTGGFAGRFNWGPIEEVTLLSSEDDMVKLFGKPNDNNYEGFLTAANFLSYANALNIVRAANTSPGEVSTTAPLNASLASSYANLQIKTSEDYYNTFDPDFGGTQVTTHGAFAAKWAGELGNSLKISICGADRPSATLTGTVEYDATANTLTGTSTSFDTELKIGDTITIAGQAAGAKFVVTAITNATSATVNNVGQSSNIAATAVATRLVRSGFSEQASQMIGTVETSSSNTTVTGTTTLFEVQMNVGDVITVNGESRKVASIASNTVLTVDSSFLEGASAQTYSRTWEYNSSIAAGAPGTSAFAEARDYSYDEIHLVIVDEDGNWSGTKGEVIEVHPNLSVASNAKSPEGEDVYYKNYVNKNSKYVWWMDHPTINSVDTTGTSGLVTVNSKDVLAWGQNVGASLSQDLNEFYSAGLVYTASFAGGSDGSALTTGDLQRGYDKFKSSEDVDVSLLMTGSTNATVVRHVINNVAESRKDCMVFFSPEKSDVVGVLSSSDATDNVIDYRKNVVNLSTSFAVMDSGWKYQFDKYNDKFRFVPLNGDIAGLCARTDEVRDPFFSPAGFTRGQINGVVKLPFNPKKAERDKLYQSQVNPVVAFPGEGTVLFGDKTLLSKSSAFDRINVRRLFILLEKAIANAARFQLFEFNDEFTRSQFVSIVEPFLRDIQGRGGIQDFAVICDTSNNTPEVVDRNEFRGDIFIKPSRAINFIQLNFVAVRSGVEFSEVVGAV